MHGRLRWLVWLMVGLLPLLAVGCEDVLPESTSSLVVDDPTALNVPTRTLGPIVSYTPRFTATPIPSITPTPSDTPVASDTPIVPTDTPKPPTATPNPTPTVEGVVRSRQGVNLREGPGTNYPVVVNVQPGTEVGVIGLQTDAQGREWYKVSYADSDGETQAVWVLGSLLDTEFKTVIAATPAAVAEDETPTAAGDRVNILAYCRQKGVRPPRVTTADDVYVEWSWYVSREELMQQHLDNANYRVELDGKLLAGWEDFATAIRPEAGRWYVYWYFPVGKLSAGQHTVDFELTWDEAITDGYAQFGPGTANETDTGSCAFTVTEA